MNTARNTPRLPRVALLFLLLLLSGCDSMIQEIDMPPSNLPPTLAVSASISTDGGVLRISFTEVRSISSYRTWRSEAASIVRSGVVALYEDDNPQPIYRLVDGGDGQGFDMSLRTEMSESGFSTEQRGLTFKAGSAYKLVLDIDGYPVATATAVMPDAPNVEVEPLSTGEVVHKRFSYFVGSGLGGSTGDERDFYPLRLRLTDNSRDRDYYMFWLQSVTIYPDYASVPSQPIDEPVGVSNWALIRDNPDLEAEGLPMESLFDVYLFNRLLMSDMSFANTTGTVDLLVPTTSAWKPSQPTPCNEASANFMYLEICMSHLSPITYDHHRSVALQREGVGFFTEPVFIASNIENGYGCFAAFNTVRDTIWSTYWCPMIYALE